MEKVTPLYPPDVKQEKEITKTDLQAMQTKADQMGILLPTELNRSTTPVKPESNNDEIQPLLPCGM